jgi:hypothetical protein
VPEDTTILGGFDTGGAARDPALYPTVLSGDLNGDDLVDRTEPGAYKQSKKDNVFHVVTMLNVSATLDGLTVQGGYAAGQDTRSQGRGGGIFINSGVTNLNNVIVKNNDAMNNKTNGAGLGGGVFLTQFSGDPGVVNVTDSLMTNNYADSQGGAFTSLNGKITILNTKIEKNRAQFCGAIQIQDGSLHMADSIMSNNYSFRSCSGIKLLATGTGPLEESVIERSQFIGNSGFDCGVILLANTSGAPVAAPIKIQDNNVFDGNEAREFWEKGLSCGAICIYSWDAVITDNHFLNNKGVTGGAICMTDSLPSVIATVEIAGNEFVGNNVDRNNGRGAGAIKVEMGQKALIHDNTFEDNKTASNGGAIAVYQAEATINDNTFTNDDASKEGDEIYAEGAQLNNDVEADNTFDTVTSNTVVIK